MLKFMRSQESVVFKKSPIHGFQHKLCTARQNNLQMKMCNFYHPIVSEWTIFTIFDSPIVTMSQCQWLETKIRMTTKAKIK